MNRISPFLASLLCCCSLVDVRAQDAEEAKKQITKEAQAAIDAGLGYLKAQQHADGSWGTQAYHGNIAVTSLAGLAFLSGGHKSGKGPNGDVLSKAIDYIISQEDKNVPGFLHTARNALHGPMYSHAFGVLFLAEAHGTITDKKQKEQVHATLKRAVQLIIKSQTRDGGQHDGGWRYQPRPGDADLSVTACQVLALRAARDAGIDVPKATMDKAVDYVKRCQNMADGGFRYQTFGGASGFARTAAALASLHRLGIQKGEPIDKGMRFLRGYKPGQKQPDPATQMHYGYGHFYAAKAMWYAGGKDWHDWYPAIRDELQAARKKDGHWTYNLNCPHYSTAIALIILQMPNHALPSLKR
jgi:hypothetical protein